jgi:hypothetical protein
MYITHFCSNIVTQPLNELVLIITDRLEILMNKKRMQEKLRASCQINSENQCWEWSGQVSNSGHGRVTFRDHIDGINRKVSAETASYIAFVDEISEGKMVRQTCSNRLCINPEHLEVIDVP